MTDAATPIRAGEQSAAARTPLAVFDLDGTCIAGQSGALISEYLIRHGFVSLPRMLALGWWGARYKLHLPHRQEEARELVFGALNKHRPSEVESVMSRFHDEVLLARYCPAALDEVARRRREGCVTLLVSATFEEIAARAAEHVGVDAYVATRMERGEDGLYTGRVEGPVVAGREKVTAVARWADEHLGPGRWYLAAAYGDHYSDLPLLAAACESYAVRPGRTLALEARRRQWPCLTWDSV